MTGPWFPVAVLVGGPLNGQTRQMEEGVFRLQIKEPRLVPGADDNAIVETRVAGHYVWGTGSNRGKMLWEVSK